MSVRAEEHLVAVIARMLRGFRHVAVGSSSPIPGSAALLAREQDDAGMQVSILGSKNHNPFTDGAKELFDCAAQGRIDAFFLGGVQIDGHANINLVGIDGYPRSRVRFPGSFGSSFLYSIVPNVILFAPRHNPRVLVEQVDFISAAGSNEPNVYRPGGPVALVTERCVFRFDRETAGFVLEAVHPGHTVDEIRLQTGFSFDTDAQVSETQPPDPTELELIRGPVLEAIREVYPRFSESVFARV